MQDIFVLKKKLAGYSAIAASFIAFASEKAEAQIVYHDIDPDILLSGPSSGASLDLNNDGVSDFGFSFESSYDQCPYENAEVSGLNGAFFLGSQFGALGLDAGSLVSSNQMSWKNHGRLENLLCAAGTYSYSYCECDWFGNFEGEKFLGIKFTDSIGLHYGWIRISTVGTLIEDYAYQLQPDSSIFAGQFDGCDTVQAIVTPPGPFEFCNWVNEVVLTVNESSSYQVQWLVNGLAAGGGNQYPVFFAGDYKAVLIGGGCSDTSNTVTFIVHQPIVPGIIQSGDTLFSTPAASYQWSYGENEISGATESSYIFTQSGWYTLSTIDSNDCSSQTQFHAFGCANIDLINSPLSSVICQGDQVFLQSYFISGTEYQWFLNDQPIAGATSASYHAYDAGQYFVTTHKASNNCRDTSGTYSLFIDNLLLPVIQQEADSLISSSSSGYQWYFNGSLIPGATNQNFVPALSGSYQVEVADSNGCTAISQSFDFIATNLDNSVAGNFFDAFVEDRHLHIQLNQSPLPLKMILFNDLGVKLREAIITQNEWVMDVSQIPSGIYFVAVDDQQKRNVKKVVIE